MRTLAFDCPRADRSGIAFCLGTPGGPLVPVLSPPLKRLGGGPCCADWSPDGQRVLVRLSQSTGTVQRDDIGMVNADGSGFVNLTNRPELGNWGATWSPDGRRIAFNSGSRLFVMNADGSGLEQVTRIWGEYPSWSPDGRLIAFASNRCSCNGVGGEGEYDVYAVRPDGTGLRRLTSWPGEELVGGWSRDGRLLAYGRNPDRWPGIWIVTRHGKQVRRLVVAAPRSRYLRGVEEWAPDGSFIVSAVDGTDPQTSTPSDYWVSADGRSTALLQSGTGGATWRPSGAGELVTQLTLQHRWIGGSPPQLEMSGRLTVDGQPAAARRALLGRLGEALPTHRLRTVLTGQDGRFLVRVDLGNGPRPGGPAFGGYWRVATAFYAGSRSEWSTTAFEPLGA